LEGSKLSVLFVAGFYYPSQIGGPCNSFYWLAKALGRAKVDVSVVAMSEGIATDAVIFDFWNETEYGKVKYVKTKFSNYSIKYIWSAIRQIHNVDVVHINSFFSLASFIIGLMTIIGGKPLIWSPRGEFAPIALQYKSGLKKIILNIAKKFHHRFVFHATSNIETDNIKCIFGTNASIIELPNYIELPPPTEIVKDNFLIYVGRIHPIKALENLIQACSMSKLFRNSNTNLLIVGDNNNEYAKYLVNEVIKLNLGNKILFVPHISNVEQKNSLLSRALFCFLPSHSENFGNVVVESLSNNTPVVASWGTPWKILEDHHAGFWVSNDPSSLTSVLDRILMMTPDEMEKYYNNARHLTNANFNIDTNVSKWVEGYKKTIRING